MHLRDVHRMESLLSRWLLGTYKGTVRHKYLDYYLNEYYFRFNRRTSMVREVLFYRIFLKGSIYLNGQ